MKAQAGKMPALRKRNDGVAAVCSGMDICESAGGTAAARGSEVGRGRNAFAAEDAAENAANG